MVNGCSEALHSSVADAYRSLALAVFGTGARDKMQLAEMSVTASIADISGAEDKSKRELAALVKRVRELDPARNRSQVLDLLARTRVLRASLASMAKKRSGMEQNLETLRQSQLNQNMLLSMKHTTDALQTLGLKVSDADNIMLDLEESTGDINALQSALSTGFDADLSQEDLDAELELVLSDDALCPAAYKRPARAPKPAEEAPAETKAPAEAQTLAPAECAPTPAAEPAPELEQPDTTLAQDEEAQADKE
jgi:hypothetical protein